MFEYDELASNAVKILDKYNFEDDIIHCNEMGYVDMIMFRDYIESMNDVEVFEALENLSSDEFREYFTIRYGVKWVEIIKYRMMR